MANTYFPQWCLRESTNDGQRPFIGTDERLPWLQAIAIGLQHVVAMFGATVLAPLLMGFDPNLAIFMSGIGTLLFFVFVGGRVPSYLGSSFAFIGLVVLVTGYSGQGPNTNMGVALGGIIACGLLYALIGLLVMATGTAWIEKLMPPVVTGAVVAVIGLNLAPIAVKGVSANPFDSGSVGGTGVTTYAENIGVMAATKIYSTLMFVVAALIALVLGFSPKFGAIIQTIPGAVLGGVSIVVFGLITVAGARIWVQNKVDFSENRNLIVAAVTLVLGAGDFTLKLGQFALGGIGTATFGAIILYAVLSLGNKGEG